MNYTVTAAEHTSFSLNETDRTASVLQNIAVILSTRKGSVPQNRTFGLDMVFLDKPSEIARTMLVAAVHEAISSWEPRAEVLNVFVKEDASQPGHLIPSVEVRIKDE